MKLRNFETESHTLVELDPSSSQFLCNLATTNCNSLYCGKIKGKASRQEALLGKGYMAELYEPFSVEFINWLFKHLHKDKCSKEFIDQVLEPECVKKLYSDMFQSSGSYTDDLFFKRSDSK